MSERLGSVQSFGYQLAETITEAKTLTNGDCGKVFYLDSAGGAYTITLPTLRAGLRFRFVVDEDTPTAAITIAASTTDVYGILEQQSDTNENNRVACAAVTNVIIGTSSLKGDVLEYECDGTNWYVHAHSSIQSALSTS